MASAYERELKGILAGEEDALRDASKTLDPEEERHYRWTAENPFLVVRGAGSLGVDLVALREEFSFPIEVKSASDEVVHFSASSGEYHEQAEEMATLCGEAGVVPLYAFRLKGERGDAWRVYSLPLAGDGLDGKAGRLHERIPNISRTREDNFVLRWSEGRPLHAFFEYLDYTTQTIRR